MVAPSSGHVMSPRLQVLREWPPGYGGIERVAHELADVWRSPVYSFDAQGDGQALNGAEANDPLPVLYPRYRLRCLSFGRLLLPLPGRSLWALLRSPKPLHGHLPSPGVLLILLLARIVRPGRLVSAHWHAFLSSGPGLQAKLFVVYQWFALQVLPWLGEVVTTSPVLADALVRRGCPHSKIKVLTCCLDAELERKALALPLKERQAQDPLKVLFIGRLESYKRLDWLLEALAELPAPWRLDVLGDGPRRGVFEEQAEALPVHFHGRVTEASKLTHLSTADVLVLPSDRSNEAFGIVQLEAMAAGMPALAFCCERSGMGWVGALPGLIWSQQPAELASVLQRLARDAQLCGALSVEARDRYQQQFCREVWQQQLMNLRASAVS